MGAFVEITEFDTDTFEKSGDNFRMKSRPFRATATAKGSGGTLGKGLQLKGNANGTGSNLVVTVRGKIAD